MTRIVVLTGAGISAESGVPTFRAADGLWGDHRIENVATPEAFEWQPEVVQRFYDARRSALASVEPNPAHRALGRLEKHLGDDLLVVTQNVDDLHERGGVTRLIHMHGQLLSAWCTTCGARHRWDGDLLGRDECPGCTIGTLRPDVVWFGEVPYQMDRIFSALETSDLFVSIGTSGAVYPAAGFVQAAQAYGARALELNLERSEGSDFFDESRLGQASELVPTWVEEILEG